MTGAQANNPDALAGAGDAEIASLIAASDSETASVLRALKDGKTAEQIAKDLVKLALQHHRR